MLRHLYRSAAIAGAALLLFLALHADAQQSPPACVSKLVPCASYLNGTGKPPAGCCDPLEEAVKNEMPCLCSVFNNADLLKAFNVDIKQALELPKRCGITQDANICKTSPGGGGASPPTPVAPGAPPPTKGSNGGNAAMGLVSIGLPGLMGLLLFWWSIMA